VIDGGIFHQVMEKLSTGALSYCFYYSFLEVSGIHSRVLGLASQELSRAELDHSDENYQVLVAIRAVKASAYPA
jgi:hypothetical protein